MNISARILVVLLLCANVRGEIRTWTLDSGKTVDGEYISVVFDNITLKGADGQQIKIPLKSVSDEDRSYVELQNPPVLTVDFLQSAKQSIPTPSPIWVDNSPVKVFYNKFGARIKQTNVNDYNHELRIVIYGIAKQIYDPSKYRLVAKIQHGPFKLTKENGRRYEYTDPKEVEIVEFLIESRYPRGQSFAEMVVLVYDERNEIIAYRSTKNWLYNNLDKLDALPVGAWFDDKCNRTHPTSPKPIWLD